MPRAGQGRLIDAVYDSGVPERGPQENYTLGLLVESQDNFPKGTTLDQYVRSLRQRVEDDNVKIQKRSISSLCPRRSFCRHRLPPL